ncbi:MAG: ribonuclease H-like domain-containing protein [Dehalococcoidia bacterium]|nr:ribonuclease H-like domain-containing protein [Dehalococcoidia bacterium]
MTRHSECDAYLDIETTGLAPPAAAITVIGIYLVTGNQDRFVQLVGDDITIANLLEALEGADTIYTYNGKRFDLPFIRETLGINLEQQFAHRDLMFDCWECNLYGGFKRVEVQLGIERECKGLNGYDAVLLWQRYQNYGDEQALDLLLRYNREDVVNLKALREKLGERL